MEPGFARQLQSGRVNQLRVSIKATASHTGFYTPGGQEKSWLVMAEASHSLGILLTEENYMFTLKKV